MKTAILAILLFCIMIFPHELGHFLAAKKVGVKVNEFAFGMGPVLWKKQGKETLYSIRLLPIGGFCAMEGEDRDAKGPGSFNSKKPWEKLLVLAAGSFMNVICAMIIMIGIVCCAGIATTTIDQVDPNGAAMEAGMVTGDTIVRINEHEIKEWAQVISAFTEAEANTSTIVVERDGQEKVLSITPEKSEDGRYVIGITSKVSHNIFRASVQGAKLTWQMTLDLFNTITRLFTGKVGVENLSGPVGMVQLVNETTTYGWWYYAFLIATICLNLAVMNLLPFPALDGGRIIFVLFTMITGKEVSQRVEGVIHFAGFALLIGLMLYVSFNDVLRIFG